MTILHRLVSILRWLFRRDGVEKELDDELQGFIDLSAADKVNDGLPSAEARRQAILELGGVEQAKEHVRAYRHGASIDEVGRDVRYAIRMFVRNPGFTCIIVGTLALGIGANTALFTLVHRVLLDALPVHAPDQLVELGCINTNDADKVGCNASYPGFRMFRDDNRVLSGVFAFAPLADLNVIHDGRAELASALLASGDMYNVLGMAPAFGRLLNPADDDQSASPVAVLSYGYWQRRFGGDPSIVGQTLRLNAHTAIIVGVTPSSFHGVALGLAPDVTLAMGSGGDTFAGKGSLANGGNMWLRMIGRRKEGVSLEQVQANLEPIYRRTVEDVIASVGASMASPVRRYLSGIRFRVQPAGTGAASAFRRDLDRPLRILMSTVALVLLIACANLGTLVLSRNAGRQRELAVRLAIGAGRGRLGRQLVTESLLLSIAGAVLGLFIARWGSTIILRLISGNVAVRWVDLEFDMPVLLFTSAVALIAGVLLAIGSVWHLARMDVLRGLREGAGKQAASRLAGLLVPGQIALATVVLIGGGLLLQTFENFLRLDLGFRSDRLLTLTVSPRLVGYDSGRTESYISALTTRLEGLPGVKSVTPSHALPGALQNTSIVDVPGFESAPPMQRAAGRHLVGARVAETWGLTLRRGRDIARSDRTADRVALVNESFAKHFFDNVDVIGRQFSFSGDTKAFTIVGVVADARDRGPKDPVERVAYTFLTREEMGTTSVALRVEGSESAHIASIREVLGAVDPVVPVMSIEPMNARIDEALRRERLMAMLGTLFGVLAIVLVGIGLYGLLAGTVAHRTREIGIRLALGSHQRSVVWLVLRQGMSLIALGLAIGLSLGIFLTRFIRSELFGVSQNDPSTVFVAVGILIVTGMAASLIPAVRAARTDPLTAIRYE